MRRLPATPSGRVQMVIDLMGGPPVWDEETQTYVRGPKLLTKRQALKLLNSVEQNGPKRSARRSATRKPQ
jgi:hypothetical protein